METPSLASRASLIVPTLPRWVPWAAGVSGLALTVVTVVLQTNDSFPARLALEIAGVVAPLLFAAAGIGALIEGWRRREWRRRTQFLAVEATERVRSALADVATTLMKVIGPALPDGGIGCAEIGSAFSLPFTQTRERVFTEATVLVFPLGGALMVFGLGSHGRVSIPERDDPQGVQLPEDPTALINALVDRALDEAPAIAAHLVRMEEAASDLAFMLDREGTALLIEALKIGSRSRTLSAKTAKLINCGGPVEAGGDSVGEIERAAFQASQYLTSVWLVLRDCRTCMRALGSIDSKLRTRSDKRLPEFIAVMQASSDQMGQETDVVLEASMDLASQDRERSHLLEEWRKGGAARRVDVADILDRYAGSPDAEIRVTDDDDDGAPKLS